MRYPRLHQFLKWAGPTVCAAIIAILSAVFLAAQTWPRLANYIESAYDMTPPFAFTLIATTFLLLSVAYVWALVYTGSPKPFKGWTTKSLEGLSKAVGRQNVDEDKSKQRD